MTFKTLRIGWRSAFVLCTAISLTVPMTNYSNILLAADPAVAPGTAEAAPAGTAPSTQSNAALQFKAKRLNKELAALNPGDPDYDQLFLTISTELREVEKQLVTAEQAGLVPMNVSTPASAATPPPVPGAPVPPATGTLVGPAANPVNPAANPANPIPGTIPVPPNAPTAAQPGGSFLQTLQSSPGNANLLQHMKNELSGQLKQIQQILKSLQPEDEALAVNLREQQKEITRELAEINRQLELTGPGKPENDPILQGLIAVTNSAVNPPTAAPNETIDPTAKKNDPPNKVAEPKPNIPDFIANPNLAALPGAKAPQGPSWNEEAAHNINPYEVLTSEDVKKLKEDLTQLRQEMKTITESIGNIESQLKILTRQAAAPETKADPTKTEKK